MIKAITSYLDDFSHLFFPHNCIGCGSDTLPRHALLCTQCFQQLPLTGFFSKPGNPIEKIFYGRIKVTAAGSVYYFSKESLLHQIIVELKYHGNRNAGMYLGKLMGNEIAMAERFNDIDIIVPLPLNEKKEKRRGYNQATVIAQAIAEIINKPVFERVVARNIFTETQTHKNRISRWQNMEGVFMITDAELLEGKHILLVDDVITTGATLEACGSEILKIQGTKLSIATIAYTI